MFENGDGFELEMQRNRMVDIPCTQAKGEIHVSNKHGEIIERWGLGLRLYEQMITDKLLYDYAFKLQITEHST